MARIKRVSSGFPHIYELIICLFIFAPVSSNAADITVSGGCSLANAIRSANTDIATAGCTAGSGADNVILTADVTLTTMEDPAESAGLPAVTTIITIIGNDYTISRDISAPLFRILKISTGGELELIRVTVENGGGVGFAQAGGGASINAGVLLVIDSTFSGNQSRDGGGIENNGGGVLGIIGSTFIMNQANERAGALLNNNGTAVIVNSTFTGNQANESVSQSGGAVHNVSGTVSILNTTFAGNKSSQSASGAIHNDSTVNLENTIFGGNTPRDCSGEAVTDLGNNLSEDVTGGCATDLLTGLSPSAQDNGGPTLTHELFDGSTAINKIGSCELPIDQRGTPRSDGSCDSGAYEYSVVTCNVFETLNFDYYGTVEHKECEIHAGPNIAVKYTGFLTLTAGKQVLIKPPFSVEKEGRFVINIDPTLLPSGTTVEGQQLLLDILLRTR